MTDLGNKEIMAKNIARFMELKGKTRNDVCKDLGFAYTTFSDWLNAKKYPRIDKIEMMANYFGCLKSELVEDSENPTDANKIASLAVFLTRSNNPALIDMLYNMRLASEDQVAFLSETWNRINK